MAVRVLALFDGVQLFFHVGREADVDDLGEIFLQQIDDDDAQFRRDELFILLFDVIAVLDGIHDGRIRTRPADTLFFQRLDQAGFGEMLLRRDGLVVDDGMGRNMGQLSQRLVLLGVFVEFRKALEQDFVACSPQFVAAAVDDDGHVFRFDRFHLAGQEAVPNECIQAQLIAGQEFRHLVRRQFQRRRTDGFMRILTGLFGLVDAGLVGDVFFAVVRRNELPRGLDHIIVDADRVRTHVGNEADVALVAHIEAFIELLGQHHRLLGAEVELADTFLLHRRRRERRLGLAFALALFDLHNRIRFVVFAAAFPGQVVGDGFGRFLRRDFGLLAVDLGQFCRQGQAVFGLIGSTDGPVFFRHESLDGFFPFTDEADGDGLDTAGAEALADFLPQKRAQFIADDAVQDAAGLLGVDFLEVDGFRVLDGLKDGFLGNFVEHDAAFVVRVDFQQMGQVPGNGLPFAVRVSCQIDLFRSDVFILQVFNEFALIPHVGIRRHEAFFDIDAELVARQIPQVAAAGHDLVAAAQEAFDSLGLGRRFDDDQVLGVLRKRIQLLRPRFFFLVSSMMIVRLIGNSNIYLHPASRCTRNLKMYLNYFSSYTIRRDLSRCDSF